MHRRWMAGRPRRSAVAAIGLVWVLVASGLALAPPGGLNAKLGPGGGLEHVIPGRVLIAPALVPSPGTISLGAVPSGTPMEVLVAVGAQHLPALEARARAASTPGSPSYGQFLSPDAVAQLLGATAPQLARAEAYFEGYGLVVHPSGDHYLLRIDGPASAMAAAFATQFERYRSDGAEFFSHATPASLPIGVPWVGAVGLGDRAAIRPAVGHDRVGSPVPSASGCSATSPLPPCALWTATTPPV